MFPRLTRLAILLGCLIGAACTSAPPRREEADAGVLAFVGADVVPMTAGGGILRGRTVLVEGGRIAAIGASGTVRIPAGARRIDSAGKFLLPGLADLHVHLEHFDDPSVLGLFLANGVTTVRNMDGRPYILEWRRAVAAGEMAGPAIHTAGPILDGDPPLLPDNTVVRGAAEAREAILAQHAAGYDFVKVYTNLSPEAYREVVAAAREMGMPVAGHVPRRLDLGEALAGHTSLEHLTDYGDWIEADDSPYRDRWHWSKLFLAMPVDDAKLRSAAERVARSGAWTVPTLIQAERAVAAPETLRAWLDAPEVSYISEEGREYWRERVEGAAGRMDEEDWKLVRQGRENRLRLLAALHAAGARVLVGTDTPNPFVVPGFSVHEELALFVEAGLSPEQALAATTREAAQFLGKLDEQGTIEVGKWADLLLLDADPLADIANTRRVAGVVLRGRWHSAQDLTARLEALRKLP